MEITIDHIRKSLTQTNGEKLRFEFSGYENRTGECTVHNINILNRFSSYGIYDYTDYLFLDFYKGTPTIYLKYFNSSENLEFTLDGYSTSEIIYEIFKLTLFSGKKSRRRI